MSVRPHRRSGEMSSLIKWAMVIMGAIIVLYLFLDIQFGLGDMLTSTLDKHFGKILAGVGP